MIRCMIPGCGWTYQGTHPAFTRAEWNQHYAAHVRGKAVIEAHAARMAAKVPTTDQEIGQEKCQSNP